MMAMLAMPVMVRSAPPPRPAPLTTAQFNRLRQVEERPPHLAVRGTRASYSSQREREMELTRASDDFWTLAYNGGFPATILAILICAAPL